MAHDALTRVHVEVLDTGIGIDPHALMRLFEPFTQADNSTSRSYGGTGLGLTISAQLIDSMGGQIDAESEPGSGTRFWFELDFEAAHEPAAGKRRAPAVPPHDIVSAPAGPSRLVLVAEDNPVNQILAMRMLERLGYRAEVAGNGHEALDAVARRRYDAVLMDCQMPELDGYEATRQIRRYENGASHVPIIAMTAHSMPGDREKCIAAGMDDYVTKPIRAAALGEALARTVGESTGPAQLREAS